MSLLLHWDLSKKITLKVSLSRVMREGLSLRFLSIPVKQNKYKKLDNYSAVKCKLQLDLLKDKLIKRILNKLVEANAL